MTDPQAQRWRLAAAAGIGVLALVCAAVVPQGARRLAPVPPVSQVEPEPSSGFAARTLVHARRHMVVAAHRLAAEAGLEILRAGGTAVDAAIATQLALNIVEPQSSGLGGGAFLVHWDAKRHELTTYDGRETAPATARPERFMRGDRPMPFAQAVHGGTSVGVPGVARLLELVHKHHGKLPWPHLFAPALRLADQGFAVGPRLSKLLADYGPDAFDARARRFFFDADGRAWPPGHTLANPDLARTLRRIATDGADVFYSGPTAEAIVAAVTDAPNTRGDLTLADLAAYRARQREPVCASYRQLRVCGMGPPSSGGLGVSMALALLSGFDLGLEPLAPHAVHLIAEAEKLAYADRDHYVADPDFVNVPSTLLDPGYLDRRRALINPAAAAAKALPGDPPGVRHGAFGDDNTHERAGTSHISIIDADGNAVAMTTTIEAAFGARIMAGGFLLNNQLTDFSLWPRTAEGVLAANAVAPGKRPRSTMAPTIVFDADGQEVRLILGSPGGSRIILFVVKALVGLIDWGLDAQRAADLPTFGSRNGPLEIENGEIGAGLAARMTALGHRITMDTMTSGLNIIVRRADGGLEGGTDPRREGAAVGN
jgi:gamma-glutamyltranspeptidase/glutathione hydrolase